MAAAATTLAAPVPLPHAPEMSISRALRRSADQLANLCEQLAERPKDSQLLGSLLLVSSEVPEPLRRQLTPVLEQLRRLRLETSAFVLIAVIGQELLASGCADEAVTALEAALRVGSCSLKLRGSVLSALSRAHWAVGSFDEGLDCMRQDLEISRELGDESGECRALANLGAAHLSRGDLPQALEKYEAQLQLSTRLQDKESAVAALTALGHMYTTQGDFRQALLTHRQCALLCRQMGKRLDEARQVGCMGTVYTALQELDAAMDCHRVHLRVAEAAANAEERCRALCNLGSAMLVRADYTAAVDNFCAALHICCALDNSGASWRATVEERAHAGLGHAARQQGDFEVARQHHEAQLDCALQAKDRAGEARAASNLGIICQHLGQYEAAVALHKQHLRLAKALGDQAGAGRAYGNLGNGYSALGQHELALRCHNRELAVSHQVGDRVAESATHGNLAIAHQALGEYQTALHHYCLHLDSARELRDSASELRALNNLGNFHCSRSQYQLALDYYMQGIAVARQNADLGAEAAAQHRLGFAFYQLGRYAESAHHYERDLELHLRLEDIRSAARAHCNLGLALKQMGELARALEHQASFLRMTIQLGHIEGHFKALGNLADVHLAQGANALSSDMYQKQLALAENSGSERLRALAHENLAVASLSVGNRSSDELAHREMALKLWRSADNCHTQECAALGALAKAQLRMGNREAALSSWKEQLSLARRLQLPSLEAEACGGLGRSLLLCGDVKVAVGLLEQQLSLLESVEGSQSQSDCFADLADCYAALGNHEQAQHYWEYLLTSATTAKLVDNQHRALCGLSASERGRGRLAEALVFTEKRLLAAHAAGRTDWQAAAYGELGCLHGLQANWLRAVECFQHQLRLARQVGDTAAEAAAACGLGEAAQYQGATAEALEWHQLELRLAECGGEEKTICRALSNLGLTQEAAGQLAAARATQERLLSQPTCDCVTQVTALTALGRLTLALGEPLVAMDALQRGLALAESANLVDEQARLCYRLGLALIEQQRSSDAVVQLRCAATILNTCRDNATSPCQQVGLWDLQSNVLAALQLLLMRELNEPAQALEQAEQCRSRALLKFLTDQHVSSFAIEALNLAEMTELACQEHVFVVYCSALSSGHLLTWLLAPTGVLAYWHCTELPQESLTQLAKTMREACCAKDSAVAEWAPTKAYCHDREESDFFLKFWNRHEALPSSTSKCTTFDGSSSVERVADFIYRLIIEPIEPYLPQFVTTGGSEPSTLLIIPPTELLLIPWSLVRPLHGRRKLLCDRFNILLAPNLASFRQARLCSEHQVNLEERALTKRLLGGGGGAMHDAQGALVLGSSNNRVEQDCCRTVAELLAVRPLLGPEATRMALLASLEGKELLHLSAPLIGAALSLTPDALQMTDTHTHSLSRVCGNFEVLELQDDNVGPEAAAAASPKSSGAGRSVSAHSLHEKTTQESASSLSTASSQAFLYSDLSSARLVVLSGPSAGEHSLTDQLQLAHAFLAAGAQCVLLRLWQPPEPALKLFLRTFYGGLLREQSVQRSFGLALRTIRDSPGFQLPYCWAAWMLMGRGGICLRSRSRHLAASIRTLLSAPLHNRNTARVCLHLVEKSLQRMGAGLNKPMFTSLSAVRGRCCQSSSEVPMDAVWSTLLVACGFRLEQVENAVFFPATDPADRLSQCSAALQSLLGLQAAVASALGQLMSSQEIDEHAALQLVYLLRDAAQCSMKDDTLSKLPVSLALWRIPGCHELLASLGLDLAEVHDEEVVVRCGSTGRQHELVLTALLAVFQPLDAPRCLPLEPHGCTTLQSSSREDFSSVPRGGTAGMGSCGSSGGLSRVLTLHVGSVAMASFGGAQEDFSNGELSPASSSAEDLPNSEAISSRQRDYIPLESMPPHPTYPSTPSQSDDEEFDSANQHQRHKLLLNPATSHSASSQCVPLRRMRSKQMLIQPAAAQVRDEDLVDTQAHRRLMDSFDSHQLEDSVHISITKVLANADEQGGNSNHNLSTITEVSDSEFLVMSSSLSGTNCANQLKKHSAHISTSGSGYNSAAFPSSTQIRSLPSLRH